MINKTAMIAIIGRPNVGKSTLTNKLTGDKVAIVSPKPQTTRNRIFGVFSHCDTQFVLLDTPGFHKPKTRLGDYMVGVIKKSVADVDAIMLVVEPIDNVGTQERMLLEHIKNIKVPVILLVNKVDTVKYDSLLPIISIYSNHYEFDAIIPISAKTGEGVSKLPEMLLKYAKPGPQLFGGEMTTDQPEIQIIGEIIREKLLICLDKEIPHGIAVEITKFSERAGYGGDSEDDNAMIDIDAVIYCEKKSHKGIIIGKQGAMLKRIGEYARTDIEKFMGAKIFLQTWIKVKENWRESPKAMRNLGYIE
ncbi:MAG: GTPase Era [Oscillospiraceae bacterium]|nr:GTPase Era [Oscillospiraceae bacterium]